MTESKTQSTSRDKKNPSTKGYSDSMDALIQINNMILKAIDVQLQSSLSLFKGAETLVKAGTKLAKENLVAHSKAMDQLQHCQSTDEAMTLQNDLLAKGFTKLIEDSTQFSELTMQVANDTLRPLQKHLTETIEQTLKAKTA